MSKAMNSDQLDLFAEAHLVNQPVVPGSEKAMQMTVGSGRRLFDWFERLPRNGVYSKTLQEYLLCKTVWRSRACFLRWKITATRSSRLLFRLAPSVPRTAETGCGLLPTPGANSSTGAGEHGTGGENLQTVMAKLLPTPTSERSGEARELRRNESAERVAGGGEVATDSERKRCETGAERTGRQEGANTGWRGAGPTVADTECIDGHCAGYGASQVLRIRPAPEVFGCSTPSYAYCQRFENELLYQPNKQDVTINGGGRFPERGIRGVDDGFSNWMDGYPVPPLAKGQKNRVNRLRALGNAVVPQVVEIIGRAIMQTEKNRNNAEV